MKKFFKITLIATCVIFFPAVILAANTTGYAWSENAGWLNANSTYGGMTVSISGITGWLWLENIGWIKMDYDGVAGATNTTSTNWGVVNDGLGNLSGYAWGENIGWINFDPAHSQVLIDTSGNFSGYAWSENIGWVKFDHSQTASRPVTTWLPDSTAPTISSIASSLGISGSTQTATVTWTTNEASSTQLEYGLTNSYGNTTTEADTSTRVTSHSTSVVLSNCQLYHVRAISKDAAANQGTSDDFTIQTACAGGLTVYPEAKSEITPTPASLPVANLEEDQQITLMQKIIELLTEIIKILIERKGLI